MEDSWGEIVVSALEVIMRVEEEEGGKGGGSLPEKYNAAWKIMFPHERRTYAHEKWTYADFLRDSEDGLRTIADAVDQAFAQPSPLADTAGGQGGGQGGGNVVKFKLLEDLRAPTLDIQTRSHIGDILARMYTVFKWDGFVRSMIQVLGDPKRANTKEAACDRVGALAVVKSLQAAEQIHDDFEESKKHAEARVFTIKPRKSAASEAEAGADYEIWAFEQVALFFALRNATKYRARMAAFVLTVGVEGGPTSAQLLVCVATLKLLPKNSVSLATVQGLFSTFEYQSEGSTQHDFYKVLAGSTVGAANLVVQCVTARYWRWTRTATTMLVISDCLASNSPQEALAYVLSRYQDEKQQKQPPTEVQRLRANGAAEGLRACVRMTGLDDAGRKQAIERARNEEGASKEQIEYTEMMFGDTESDTSSIASFRRHGEGYFRVLKKRRARRLTLLVPVIPHLDVSDFMVEEDEEESSNSTRLRPDLGDLTPRRLLELLRESLDAAKWIVDAEKERNWYFQGRRLGAESGRDSQTSSDGEDEREYNAYMRRCRSSSEGDSSEEDDIAPCPVKKVTPPADVDRWSLLVSQAEVHLRTLWQDALGECFVETRKEEYAYADDDEEEDAASWVTYEEEEEEQQENEEE